MVYFIVILLTIGVDQITKAMVINSLALYEGREIIPGFFNLVYVTNKGAAFSMLARIEGLWVHYFFLGVAAIASVALTVLYFRWRRLSRWFGLSLGLIVGGALGNVVDRVRVGAVTDFLDFYVGGYHWPSFNVADSAICVGAALLLIINLTVSEEKTS